jgi:DNA-binding MarR family transcriptional regulator
MTPVTADEPGYARPIPQVPALPTPHGQTAGAASERIRRLLHRREVATARIRLALARRLGISEIESMAVFHISQRGELSQTQLGALLDLTSGGVAALVQRLEQEGHVMRSRAADDGRVRLVRLSPAMVDHVTTIYGPLVEELDRMVLALEGAEHVVAPFLEAVARASEAHADRMAARDPRDAEANPQLTPALWG